MPCSHPERRRRAESRWSGATVNQGWYFALCRKALDEEERHESSCTHWARCAVRNRAWIDSHSVSNLAHDSRRGRDRPYCVDQWFHLCLRLMGCLARRPRDCSGHDLGRCSDCAPSGRWRVPVDRFVGGSAHFADAACRYHQLFSSNALGVDRAGRHHLRCFPLVSELARSTDLHRSRRSLIRPAMDRPHPCGAGGAGPCKGVPLPARGRRGCGASVGDREGVGAALGDPGQGRRRCPPGCDNSGLNPTRERRLKVPVPLGLV